ncbi:MULTISPECIES: ABC transporter permease [unclassified Streptomyces]|uniref:ABC transporter permease n=1 Tax=unclassified Streptomyces TaxID=2593676 RepID=UPI000C26FCB6|nr:ABC transporter permease [Streptomyces sp. CB02959]PJN39966.1 ABC transporter permease [Streptomyces sp. CB02959]
MSTVRAARLREPGPPPDPARPHRTGRHRPAGAVRALLPLLPLLAVVVLAVAGPWLAPLDPGRIVAAPYETHGAGLLGTDGAGRDVWARFLAGGRPLVLIPLLATAVTTVLGTAIGVLAAYAGRRPAALVARLDTLLLALPPVLVLLVLLYGWGYHTGTLVTAVAVTGVPFVSRVARAATAQVLHAGYVDQAVALGDGPVAVMAREIVPNIVRPVLADAGTRLAVAVALTASAGFLGFGPDSPDWGAMISQNMEGVTLAPWGVAAPAAGLAVLTVSVNLGLDRLTARIAP